MAAQKGGGDKCFIPHWTHTFFKNEAIHIIMHNTPSLFKIRPNIEKQGGVMPQNATKIVPCYVMKYEAF